jgi:phosphatidylglycerol:prolipoprotein diacylglycerol transferase
MAISFPNIDPVAIALGPFKIRWYALAYLSGFLLGWWYALRLVGYHKGDDKRALTKADIDDFLPWTIFGVIFGGRIGYVLFYQLGFYIENPASLFMIWQGGMSFHGGALGVIAAMIAYAKFKKKNLLMLADIVCCCVPIGLFFGRVANFVNGELYGRVTAAPWGVVFPNAGGLPRHPSQLYEALLEGLVLFIILAVLYHKEAVRKTYGLSAALFLFFYGSFRFIIEFFRQPDGFIGYIGGILTMGQILCFPMILGGLVLFFIARKQSGLMNRMSSDPAKTD